MSFRFHVQNRPRGRLIKLTSAQRTAERPEGKQFQLIDTSRAWMGLDSSRSAVMTSFQLSPTTSGPRPSLLTLPWFYWDILGQVLVGQWLVNGGFIVDQWLANASQTQNIFVVVEDSFNISPHQISGKYCPRYQPNHSVGDMAVDQYPVMVVNIP